VHLVAERGDGRIVRTQCSGRLSSVSARSLSPSSTVSSPTASTTASSATASSATASPATAASASDVPLSSSGPLTSAPAARQLPATEIGTGPTDTPMVAVTFHGGGDPSTATDILDICAQRGARITVLAIGTWLQANPQLATAIVSRGHDLGNHTWSHPVLSDLGADDVRAEITRCRDLLVQLTGSAGPWFRTSSGQHASPLILRLAGEAGYPVCLSYDVDPEDWTDPGAAAVRAGVARAVAGSVVSLHLGHQGTVEALPAILDDLQARGLQPVTATTLLTS